MCVFVFCAAFCPRLAVVELLESKVSPLPVHDGVLLLKNAGKLGVGPDETRAPGRHIVISDSMQTHHRTQHKPEKRIWWLDDCVVSGSETSKVTKYASPTQLLPLPNLQEVVLLTDCFPSRLAALGGTILLLGPSVQDSKYTCSAHPPQAKDFLSKPRISSHGSRKGFTHIRGSWSFWQL